MSLTEADRAALNRKYANVSTPTDPTDPRNPRANGGPLAVRKASEVTPTEVRWLWDQRIAYSKLNVLGGPPGVGKSYLTCALVAAVSRGGRMPGDGRADPDPQRAVLLSYEDDAEDTLRPRLDLLGADLDRVEIIEGVHHDERVRAFGVDDVRLLADHIADGDVGLVVVDPVSAFVGAGTDEHRGNEVRAALEELRTVAQEHAVAVVLVMHTRKSSADTALNRLSGSQAYGALVRSALMAGPIPDDEQERHALAHVKHNLSAKQSTLAYAVDGHGLHWHGEVDLDGEEVAGNDDAGGRSAGDDARAFLRETLADGAVPAVDVLAEAKNLGIAKNTLHRAKKALGIDSVREDGRWFWLPLSDPRSPTSPGTTFGDVGDLDGDHGASGPGEQPDEDHASAPVPSESVTGHRSCHTCGRRSFVDPCRDCQGAA